MRRRRFFSAGGAAVLGPFALPPAARAAESQPPSDDLIREFEARIPKLMAECVVPGLSIIVVRPKDRRSHIVGARLGRAGKAGRKSAGHSGGQSGFRSLAMASVEKRSGFIVLTNSDSGGKLINHPKMLELLGRSVTGE